ncbi:MAG: DUF4347 domain-containing protein [Janthinobacterium lividum]
MCDQFILEELEKRLLFSADAGMIAMAMGTTLAAESALYQGAVLPAAAPAASSVSGQETQTRRELVFIDGAVDDAAGLASQLRSQHDDGRVLEVYVLDGAKDGVAQISAVLADRHDVNAVHIISHGSDAELQLGSTALNGATLFGNAVAISTWGEALVSGADILLYGCDVAQSATGQQFVNAIGQLTGADIEASVNLTGSSLLQGDWNLEYQHGGIETKVALSNQAQTSYQGVLATFTVSTNADSGPGSLRDALASANASAGTDTIQFAIGAGTITLATSLPDITDTTIIDGRTASGYSGTPVIEINGNGNGIGLSFSSSSDGSAVYGLSITNFSTYGIALQTGADQNTIQGNYLGLRPDGVTALGNGGGIMIASADNLIGGTTAAQRNVASGNSGSGIIAMDSVRTTIQGNYLGTNAAGTAALPNYYNGVYASGGSDLLIGGTLAGSGNLISGNLNQGVFLDGVTGLTIQGNQVGTNAAGTSAIGNGTYAGIFIRSSENVLVGDTTAAGRNLVSGNSGDGIYVETSDNVQVIGNYAGTDISGTLAIANSYTGISIFSGSNITVGGTAPGSGNLLSGNNGAGMFTGNAVSGLVIQGNLIGLNAAGTAALGNQISGLQINGTGILVGGGVAGAGNVISGSQHDAIVIASSGNFVYGNYLGTDISGLVTIGNGYSGVKVTASNNTVGSTTPGYGNLIRGGNEGVFVGAGATGVTISGNLINGNRNLGIELDIPYGVTPNDAGDADTGANDQQNYPVILGSEANASTILINAVLNSKPLTTYMVEFFASRNVNASGYGEGEKYLASTWVTTDANGNASLSMTFDNAANVGLWLSATATDVSTGDTSEFARSIRVVQTNQPPLGADKTVATLEDHSYTFSVGDFGFSDPQDNPVDAFAGVFLASLPAVGSLTNGGMAVAVNSLISAADIGAGKLVYSPLAGDHGAALARFTFKVKDNGGAAIAGSDTDQIARTMTIDVVSVNNAPTGSDHMLTVQAGLSYVFDATDFGYQDMADHPADRFASVLVVDLPASGVLRVDGKPVSAGSIVGRDAIDAGRFSFTAAPFSTLAAVLQFSFRVGDDGGVANGGADRDVLARLMTMNVLPDLAVTQFQTGTVAAPLNTNNNLPAPLQAVAEQAAVQRPPVEAAAAASARATSVAPNPAPLLFAIAPIPPSAQFTNVVNADATLQASRIDPWQVAAMKGMSGRPADQSSVQQHGLRDHAGLQQRSLERRDGIASQAGTGKASGAAALPVRAHFIDTGTTQIIVTRAEPVRIEAALAVTVLGGVWMIGRKVALLASLLSTVPGWMRLDPLPILDSADDEPEEMPEETAQSAEVEHLFTVSDQAQEADEQKQVDPESAD